MCSWRALGHSTARSLFLVRKGSETVVSWPDLPRAQGDLWQGRPCRVHVPGRAGPGSGGQGSNDRTPSRGRAACARERARCAAWRFLSPVASAEPCASSFLLVSSQGQREWEQEPEVQAAHSPALGDWKELGPQGRLVLFALWGRKRWVVLRALWPALVLPQV